MWGRQESRKTINLPHGDVAALPEEPLQLLLVRGLRDHQVAGQVELVVKEVTRRSSFADAGVRICMTGIAQLIAATGDVLVRLWMHTVAGSIFGIALVVTCSRTCLRARGQGRFPLRRR